MHATHTWFGTGALLALSLVGLVAHAQSEPLPWDTTVRVGTQSEDPRMHFRTQSTVTISNIVVPTVVEIPLRSPSHTMDYWDSEALVVDKDGIILPAYIRSWSAPMPTPLTVVLEAENGHVLTDGMTTTGVTFALPESREGLATFLLVPEERVTLSGVSLTFGKNVTPPTHIEIRSREANGVESILLSRTQFWGSSVSFLPTPVSQLIVYLEYGQPLEVTELRVVEDTPRISNHYGVRFLAQPGVTYTVYTDPDDMAMLPYQDVSHLMRSVQVPTYADGSVVANPLFVPADSDKDGVSNMYDNCPEEPNPDQVDIDQNRIGDMCDDYDRDGRMNDTDNCISLPNSDQRDTDGDGEGDVCDAYENRFTERLPWVPWASMLIVVCVLIGLFITVHKQSKTITKE